MRRVLLRRLGVWASSDFGEYRFAAVVRTSRWHPPVPVELVVAPWTERRSEIRIQVRALRLPDGYFDAAHCVIDALVDHVEDALVR